MKCAAELPASVHKRFPEIVQADLLEIDNPDPYRPACRNYMDRVEAIVSAIESRFPQARGVRVAEVGPAQSNISLLLAEKGYKVTAFEISRRYIDYARLKYQRGSLRWV